MSNLEVLTRRYWCTGEDGAEREVDRAEWAATTISAGVHPETMRWSTRYGSGRQEYVLPSLERGPHAR